MLQTDATSLAAWLRDAQRALEDAGVASPRFDAERLAAFGLGLTWSDLWTRLKDHVDRVALDGLVARRCAGEPLGYITGSVVFQGIELFCGPGVLVPRPETETLVDVGLELIVDVRDPIVLDIGTGTGAIGIAIARKRPDALVVATDVSHEALAYAARNVAAAGVDVRLVRGDLYAAAPQRLLGRIDLIVSNPPYIPNAVALPADVGAEPQVALRAGPRGDEVLLRIAEHASDWLAPRGALALEVGTPDQADQVSGRLSVWASDGRRCDDTGRPRVVWARR